MISTRGTGIVVTNGHSRSANALTSALVGIFGGDLIGLWLGEDIVTDVSNNVLNWPGRVGGVLEYGPNRDGYFARSTNGARASIYGPNPIYHQRTLRKELGTAIKSIWAISDTLETYSLTCNLACSTTINSGLITVDSVSWFTPFGQVTRANGTISSLLAKGVPTVYESELASSTDTGFAVGGYYACEVPRSAWPWKINFGMALSVVPSTGSRTPAIAAIRQYYGF